LFKEISSRKALSSNAEGAISGLIFHGGIPPAIKVKDMVGFGEGNSHTTGF
jgi:hypothetical protein